MDRGAGRDGLEIAELQSAEDAAAFRVLNEEWITKLFALEEKDREVLGDPLGTIVARGGRIFLARQDGETVGCVALVPFGDRIWELSKMAVTPHLRNGGIGRALLKHALAVARAMGGRRLFLGSSKKLPGALHLYESVGFRHVPVEELPPLPYARADVFMALELE
jgi:GNAT superfamily N-acetyltransferase